MDKVNYKDMYLKMMRETERAISILIQAQRDCEEMYLSAEEAEEQEIQSNNQETC